MPKTEPKESLEDLLKQIEITVGMQVFFNMGSAWKPAIIDKVHVKREQDKAPRVNLVAFSSGHSGNISAHLGVEFGLEKGNWFLKVPKKAVAPAEPATNE